MQQERLQPPLWPISIVAVRNNGGQGWKMLTLEGALQDLPQGMAEAGFGGAEHRIVGTGRVISGHPERFAADQALKAGWHKDRETGAWFPIEEPLSRLPGAPVQAYLSIRLKSIMYGWIIIAVEAGGKALDLGICDIDDSLVLVVRFIQVLASGGEPHAALAERATAHAVVENDLHPDVCRFHLSVRREQEAEIIDVLTDRNKLIRQLRDLAAAIADHPWILHHYLCHCSLPTDEYDRVSDAAELDWETGVKEGRYFDDIDARDEFVAARIVAEVPMPHNCAVLAEQERAMLRSLKIPDEWLLSYGLVSQSVS